MTTAKKKTGRKPLAINAKVVEGMARVGATDTEIAAFLRCSVDTITRRFAEILDKSRGSMKISLRRLQWAAAKRGDRTMLIWLGKQYLAQSDKQELTGKGGEPIAHAVTVTFVRSSTSPSATDATD
jgi:hypothetical protein